MQWMYAWISVLDTLDHDIAREEPGDTVAIGLRPSSQDYGDNGSKVRSVTTVMTTR
jgi:hypothetical protein